MTKKYLKVVPVEAVKIIMDDDSGSSWFSEYPRWLQNARAKQTLQHISRTEWKIHTSHGPVIATIGDYICSGDDGYIWPIAGDTFERIYREVEDA